jgi:hypothetical protein
MLAYGVTRSRVLHLPGALLLVAGLSLRLAVAAPRAQEASSPLAGTWQGTARLSNDSPPSTCRYEGGEGSVVLKLQTAEVGLRAVVRLEAPGTPGSGCPPLRKRFEATNVVVTGSAVAFIDPAGHEWTLGLREGRLVGLVAWKGGGKDEPLAEAFVPPGGPAPLARLSGEVSLTRAAGEEPRPAAPSGTPAEGAATDTSKTPTKGSKFWPAFIGANVIGIGAFYGIKKVTDDTGAGGTATCSPRFCVYGGVNDPCNCNLNITSGASCGQTTNGVPFGGACNDTTLPCQADLSCNNRVCDDRLGRCPF